MAEEALFQDPRSSRAYTILALTHFWDYWLGPPKSPDESIRLGIEMAQKATSMTEAIPILEKALRLCPVKPFSMSLAKLGNSYRMIEKYEEALPYYRRLLKDLPMHLPENIGLIATYAQMGRMEDARAQAAELMKIDPRFALERWARTSRYRDPTDTELILDALRKAELK